MSVGLIITEHLAGAVPLAEADYLADSQVRGLSGGKIKAILERHEETRRFTSEGGRTSRATRSLAIELAGELNAGLEAAGFNALGDEEKEKVRNLLQGWFVERVQIDWFGKQRIKADLDPLHPVSSAVGALLAAARARGGNAAGAVAQHLVGAKLELRFPLEEIVNESYTTADQQTARGGDFMIGDTAIHVTVSPGDPLFSRRCADNLTAGFRPWVLVPEDRLVAAQQLAANAGGSVAARASVASIEAFVGSNVEEMAAFQAAGIRSGLRELLETYNSRVDEAEADKSLLIEIPANL